MSKIVPRPTRSAAALLSGLLLSALLAISAGPLPVVAEEPALTVTGLELPASFTGTLPCADCEGIRHHLDLWPDQVYHLSRLWLGREEGVRQDSIGRWYADPALNAIVLTAAEDEVSAWEVKGADRLRLLDQEGNPIESALPYDLESKGSLEEAELTLPLTGLFTYYADAALFQDCVSGRRYPVSDEAEYLTIERAYVAARPEPGKPMIATLDATLAVREAMEGPPRLTVVIDRFQALWPKEDCARVLASPLLTDTYWRFLSLEDEAITPAPESRPPYLLLLAGEESRFAATVGCNMKIGRYAQEDEALSFPLPASTMMACPEPLDRLERRLDKVLGATKRFRRAGYSLVLLDESGGELATLEAAFPR